MVPTQCWQGLDMLLIPGRSSPGDPWDNLDYLFFFPWGQKHGNERSPLGALPSGPQHVLSH